MTSGISHSIIEVPSVRLYGWDEHVASARVANLRYTAEQYILYGYD